MGNFNIAADADDAAAKINDWSISSFKDYLDLVGISDDPVSFIDITDEVFQMPVPS